MIFLYLSSILSLQITPDSATMGDTMIAKVEGKITDSLTIIIPDSFPDIAILDSIKKSGDTLATLKFTSFSTGAQKFKLRAKKDTLVGNYFIKSVLEPKNKGISPIIGPIGFFNWHYLLWLLVVPVGFIVYFMIKKFRKGEIQLIEEEEMEPGEEALENLKILEEKVDDWSWNKLYTSLSYIARRYIERKVEIPAVEATTSELVPLIKKEGYDIFFPFTKQFPQWDLIKFADEESTQKEFERDLTLVRSIVNEMELEKEEEKVDSLQ